MPKARPCRTSRSSEQGRLLGDAVVVDEQLLELVDDQQDARQPGLGLGGAVALEVLHAQLAEQVAAAAQLDVELLQHAEAEFPLALDGDDPGVRQGEAGVGLELHPFLEVDQVQLDLVGAVAQGQVGDQHVQQRRFARARLAGDQHVLRGALAQVEVLQFHGPGAAQGHVDAAAAVGGPPLGLVGHDALERAPRRGWRPCTCAPHGADDLGEALRPAAARPAPAAAGRSRDAASRSARPSRPAPGPRVSRSARWNCRGEGSFGIDAQKREDAAAGPAGDDALQAMGRRLGEVGGEIGHHQHPVGLGHLAGESGCTPRSTGTRCAR